MNEWPFEMPVIGSRTEYGEVVAILDDGCGSYAGWLDELMELAGEAGLERGGSEELGFWQALDIEVFACDYICGFGRYTAFIGVAFSDEDSITEHAVRRIAAKEWA